jgi:hypothetical protein
MVEVIAARAKIRTCDILLRSMILIETALLIPAGRLVLVHPGSNGDFPIFGSWAVGNFCILCPN